MNSPLSTSYLYGSGLSPADEDLKILSADALERVLTSPWTIHEELKRVVVDGEIITQFDFFIVTDDGDRHLAGIARARFFAIALISSQVRSLFHHHAPWEGSQVGDD